MAGKPSRRGGVTDVDRGARALLKRLGGSPKHLRVGVYGDAAAQKHADTNATIGEIANAHEFGVGVPERSWLRDTIEAEAPVINAGLKRAALAVMRGRLTPERALDLLGLALVGKIQSRIASGIAPALGHSEGSKRYLRMKLRRYPGATTALIASGQFRGSIASSIEESRGA